MGYFLPPLEIKKNDSVYVHNTKIAHQMQSQSTYMYFKFPEACLQTPLVWKVGNLVSCSYGRSVLNGPVMALYLPTHLLESTASKSDGWEWVIKFSCSTYLNLLLTKLDRCLPARVCLYEQTLQLTHLLSYLIISDNRGRSWVIDRPFFIHVRLYTYYPAWFLNITLLRHTSN